MSTFQVGVAVRDITPEPGVPMWGYSERVAPATGVLDPLYAKCVVFRAGDKTAVLVALDLGRVPLDDSIARIRERAKGAGVDYVFLTATHTHHAPVMEAPGAPHVQMIETAIGDCIEEAVGKLEPARIGIGRTQTDIAHNRRKLLEDGRCFMLWRNEEKVPTKPVDKEVSIIKIAAEDGTPRAYLVHYACHPVVMGQTNMDYSADYVGEMARLAKEKTGAECVFLQGGCGNINPYLDKTRMDEGAVEAMRSVGKTVADAILAAVDAIAVEAPQAPQLYFMEKRIVVGSRWDVTDPGSVDALRQVHGPMFDIYINDVGPNLAVPLNILLINDTFAFVGMPGEIFVQYQLALKTGSPLRDTFLCGYTGGYYGYFPTIRDAAAGGYGGTVASFVGIGAGDKLVIEAEAEIARMTGGLKPTCTLEDFELLE